MRVGNAPVPYWLGGVARGPTMGAARSVQGGGRLIRKIGGLITAMRQRAESVMDRSSVRTLSAHPAGPVSATLQALRYDVDRSDDAVLRVEGTLSGLMSQRTALEHQKQQIASLGWSVERMSKVQDSGDLRLVTDREARLALVPSGGWRHRVGLQNPDEVKGAKVARLCGLHLPQVTGLTALKDIVASRAAALDDALRRVNDAVTTQWELAADSIKARTQALDRLERARTLHDLGRAALDLGYSRHAQDTRDLGVLAALQEVIGSSVKFGVTDGVLFFKDGCWGVDVEPAARTRHDAATEGCKAAIDELTRLGLHPGSGAKRDVVYVAPSTRDGLPRFHLNNVAALAVERRQQITCKAEELQRHMAELRRVIRGGSVAPSPRLVLGRPSMPHMPTESVA